LYWADSEGPFKNVAKMIEAYWLDPEGPYKNFWKLHGPRIAALQAIPNGPYKNIKRYLADTDSPFMKSVNRQRVKTRRENKKYDSNRIIVCNHCHTPKEAPKHFGRVDCMKRNKIGIFCNGC